VTGGVVSFTPRRRPRQPVPQRTAPPAPPGSGNVLHRFRRVHLGTLVSTAAHVRALATDGNEIGNHTKHTTTSRRCPVSTWSPEFRQSQSKFANATGVRPQLRVSVRRQQ
jgi:hypothetical protein